MKCPPCQFENRAGARFCLECGEKLEMKCPGCGNFLGWIYSDLGWIPEAKRLNKESYQVALEIGSGAEEAEANAIVNLAENAVAERDFERGASYLEDLSKKTETDPGYLLNKHRWEVRKFCTLGEIFLHREEHDEAMKCAKRPLRLQKKR